MKPKRGRSDLLSITQRLIRCPKMGLRNKKQAAEALHGCRGDDECEKRKEIGKGRKHNCLQKCVKPKMRRPKAIQSALKTL
ncbi:hypothetical protein GCWU000325_02417 [Alloprevotella tannerae ATCC 51259]|uniref:Uncharacterized protein n=1 Tax=Alloprevotella tannerae ATCC 51259 TaxID=626522 RepID=C9LJK3_9BACT|nr:hypothetical protein GCWU000325_02417 [Alloprevotella tannerae ATCC 51259]